MPESQPLQALADVLDVYVDVVRSHVPHHPTIEQWAATLPPEVVNLVRLVDTTPLELASLVNSAALGHLSGAALCLRAESYVSASALVLLRAALEAGANLWHLCEHEPGSQEGLQRLASARVDADRRAARLARPQGDLGAAERHERSGNDTTHAARQIGLTTLAWPGPTKRLVSLLGEEGRDAYDFLSGIAHAQPADVQNLIASAAERSEDRWEEGVAVIAAVFLAQLLRGHAHAFLQFLAVSGVDPATAAEDLRVVLEAAVHAANAAMPANW